MASVVSSGMLVPWVDLIEVILLVVIVVMVKRK